MPYLQCYILPYTVPDYKQASLCFKHCFVTIANTPKILTYISNRFSINAILSPNPNFGVQINITSQSERDNFFF